MNDVTYCRNAGCPYDDCERHPSILKGLPKGTEASFARFDCICRRYIYWLTEQVEKEKMCDNESEESS